MSLWWSALAVASGAVLGALARWVVGMWLNPVWSGFPVGTLAVNLVGGLAAGALMVYLSREPNEALRLLLVTGVLGALTTFSTFSVESLTLIERGRPGLALAHTLTHVLGALACAAAGARLMRAYLA